MHMQKTLRLFVLLQLFSRTVSADRFEKEYCGFEHKCAGNQTDVEQRERSCCRPCECIDICKEKETCCADLEGIAETTTVIKQQCLSAAYLPKGVHVSTEIQSYYTRAHCPEAFKDKIIKGKCQNETSHSLDDITFVSSEDGTIVYKNRFCGICHGEMSTIPWNLTISLDCGLTLTKENMTLKNIVSTLLTECEIRMTAPKHMAIENNVCFDRSLLISECNKTGEWETFDGDLQKLCLNSSGALYYNHVTSRGLLTYRSVYCYLCNSKTNSARESCEPPGNICRRLYCPTFFLPRYGHCIRIIKSKFYYPLVVRIVAQEVINNSETLKKELKSRYVGVLKRLGFGGCMLCHVYIYMKRILNESLLPDMYLRLALTATDKCNLDEMESKLAEFEMRPINISIRLDQKLRAFTAFWDYETLWPNKSFEKVLKLKRSMFCPLLPLTRASHCPKVKLTADENQAVLKKHINADDLLIVPNQEDGNRTVYVCCNKYVVNKRSTGVAKELNVEMAFIVTVTIACVAFQHN